MNLIITGASKGIGKYLLEQFKNEGAQVWGTYKSTKPTSNAERYVQLDVTDEKAVENFVKTKATELKNIALIHCAGINVNAFTHKMALNDWNRVLNNNLTSAFVMSKALLPLMREQGFGRILFFSSIVPEMGVPGTAAYAASKAGLWGLMKTLSKEGAAKNVTCNTLNLGYFNIGMISEVPEPVLAKTIQTIPMQKLGDPKNIYQAVQFVLNSDYFTGSEISINGGLY